MHLVGWKKIALPKNIGGLGIRASREVNVCLLGKLVWDLIQENNKLWIHILSKKYSAGHNFFNAAVTSSSSPIWSSIIRARNTLISGYSWRAGSGSSSFWFSRWSEFGTLGSLVPIIDIHDTHLTVKDVMTTNGQRTQLLYTTLPPAVAEFVNNKTISFNAAIDDAFIWNHNKNGTYSSKSGYQWLLSLQNHDLDTLSWTWIWRQKLPEKYKFFIWLACQNSLPTLVLLHHRNIALSPICTRCGNSDETVIHCIRDCNCSRQIWHHIGFAEQSFFSEACVRNWIREVVDCSFASKTR